jgi:hypothetical protein
VKWVSLNWLVGSWPSATTDWIRYMRRGQRGWTVAALRGTGRNASMLHSEDFGAWARARWRVADLARDIEQGGVDLDPPLGDA